MKKYAYLCRKRETMFNHFTQYLYSEKIDYRVEDSVVYFDYNGLHFLFPYDKNDPYYFRLILPNCKDVTTENQQLIYTTINGMNKSRKAVKSFVFEESVWIVLEQFVYSIDNIDDFFTRAIQVVESYYREFKGNKTGEAKTNINSNNK